MESAPNQNNKGSIVCVSLGMTLGAHLTPICRSHIEKADIVFTSAHSLLEQWVQQMNTNVHSLQYLYAEGKDRRKTYHEMVEIMMTEVRKGKRVVSAFYGHTGVFAWSPHKVIEVARLEGYSAKMEAGVSAEDCLYADLGIDPGRVGSQHFEASQYMLYQRRIDPTAYLILWQVGITGDQSIKRYSTSQSHRQILIEMLIEEGYSSEHKIALYECPSTALSEARIDWMPLSDFATADMSLITTMVIPPARKMQKNKRIINKLNEVDANSLLLINDKETV